MMSQQTSSDHRLYFSALRPVYAQPSLKLWLAGKATAGRRGFTAVELLLVMGVTTILISVAVPFAGNFRGTHTIKSLAEGTKAALVFAQTQARTARYANDVGVSFTPTGYSIYVGDTAVSPLPGARQFPLPGNYRYSWSGSSDVNFAKNIGSTDADNIITITDINTNQTARIYVYMIAPASLVPMSAAPPPPPDSADLELIIE